MFFNEQQNLRWACVTWHAFVRSNIIRPLLDRPNYHKCHRIRIAASNLWENLFVVVLQIIFFFQQKRNKFVRCRVMKNNKILCRICRMRAAHPSRMRNHILINVVLKKKIYRQHKNTIAPERRNKDFICARMNSFCFFLYGLFNARCGQDFCKIHVHVKLSIIRRPPSDKRARSCLNN